MCSSVRWFVSNAMIRGKAASFSSQYFMRPCSTWQSAPSQSVLKMSTLEMPNSSANLRKLQTS
eukprot:3333682-Alexandrium_andersonii.AAC.1